MQWPFRDLSTQPMEFLPTFRAKFQKPLTSVRGSEKQPQYSSTGSIALQADGPFPAVHDFVVRKDRFRGTASPAMRRMSRLLGLEAMTTCGWSAPFALSC